MKTLWRVPLFRIVEAESAAEARGIANALDVFDNAGKAWNQPLEKILPDHSLPVTLYNPEET